MKYRVLALPAAALLSLGALALSGPSTPDATAAVAPAASDRAPIPAAPGSSCDPNYAGACVPIASDVDCAGGSGNGPAYVAGPVQVIGTDIYGLDRDGDGVGCQ